MWGDDTSTGNTGAGTASDNCDPTPAIAFVDQQFAEPVGSGLEARIERTWTATDCLGFTSSCTQTIYLASPKANAANPNLDLDLTSCPNVFVRAVAGIYDVTVLTNAKVNAALIDWSTVTLQRRIGGFNQLSLAAANFKIVDAGRVTATAPGQCNSRELDGKADLRIGVDHQAIIGALAFDAEAAGAQVEICITGKLVGGAKSIPLRDFVTIQ